MYSFSIKQKCNVRCAPSLPLLHAHQSCNTKLTVEILLMIKNNTSGHEAIADSCYTFLIHILVYCMGAVTLLSVASGRQPEQHQKHLLKHNLNSKLDSRPIYAALSKHKVLTFGSMQNQFVNLNRESSFFFSKIGRIFTFE